MGVHTLASTSGLHSFRWYEYLAGVFKGDIMSETFLAHEPTFLNLLLQHASLQDMFARIVRMAEERAPGTKCVISIYDEGRSREDIDDGCWYRLLESSIGQTIGSIRL